MTTMQTSVFSPTRSLLIAGGVITLAVALKLLTPDYISSGFGDRALGVMLGLLVVIYANAVPKALAPLLQSRCDPAADQALRRFTGVGLVLGGLGYSAAWMLAPLDQAALIGGGLLATALVTVIARVGWMSGQGSRKERR